MVGSPKGGASSLINMFDTKTNIQKYRVSPKRLILSGNMASNKKLKDIYCIQLCTISSMYKTALVVVI